MPKVLLTQEQKMREKYRRENEEIRALIGAYLATSGKTLDELGEALLMSHGTINRRKKDPGTFRLSEFRQLLEVIG